MSYINIKNIMYLIKKFNLSVLIISTILFIILSIKKAFSQDAVVSLTQGDGNIITTIQEYAQSSIVFSMLLFICIMFYQLWKTERKKNEDIELKFIETIDSIKNINNELITEIKLLHQKIDSK